MRDLRSGRELAVQGLEGLSGWEKRDGAPGKRLRGRDPDDSKEL
jgi:hypothetical protein